MNNQSLKIASTSISTLMISSGMHIHIMQIETSAGFFAIWGGIILLFTMGILILLEKIEKDFKIIEKNKEYEKR